MMNKKSADVLAAVLTAVAWFWTAFECSTIGIDVFDMILLKERTGGLFVWILAAVLTVLTFLWMRPHLITRAIMGIFMLLPATVFRFTRLMVPESGFAPVHLLVGFMYILAVIGMYGMFYPWKIRQGLAWLAERPKPLRVLGGALTGLGILFCALGGAAAFGLIA
jgi:hypothetical protein